jgi:DNA-binding NarL/FixJ family response regulator
MRDGYMRGVLPRTPTARQVDVLAAFVAAGGSVQDAADLVGIRPSTVKRHLADLLSVAMRKSPLVATRKSPPLD